MRERESFQGGEGTRADADVQEDLTKIGWFVEVDNGRFFEETGWWGVRRCCKNHLLRMCLIWSGN